jgi:hypothetical protein
LVQVVGALYVAVDLFGCMETGLQNRQPLLPAAAEDKSRLDRPDNPKNAVPFAGLISKIQYRQDIAADRKQSVE